MSTLLLRRLRAGPTALVTCESVLLLGVVAGTAYLRLGPDAAATLATTESLTKILLITAVWTQLARLEVQQKGQGESSGGESPQTKIAVMVHASGFAVVVDQDQRPLPEVQGDYDYATLTKELKRLKESYPDKTDVQVLSEDAIKFDVLVKTMDAAMAAGFPDLSLLDAGSAAL